MKTKRIAILCQHFYPEMLSTGLFITQLAVGLAQRGWSVRVYCGQPSYQTQQHAETTLPRYRQYEGVEIVRVPALGAARGGLLLRLINALLFLCGIFFYLIYDRKQIYGIISTTNPPFLGVAACLLNIFSRVPFVTLVHDLYPEAAICSGVLRHDSWLALAWHKVTKFILTRSAGIIVIGRDMAEMVKQKFTNSTDSDLVIIPNWADARHIRPIPRSDNAFIRQHNLQDEFVVQYSGRLGRVHNLEPLLEAAHLLRDHPVRFQFIGEGAKRQNLEALSKTLNLPNVQFLPYQPYESLANSLAAAHLSVVCLENDCTSSSVPSKTYGILASGRPILALVSPESEVGQLVQELACGVVMPEATGTAIATVIAELMANPAHLEQMGQNGYRAFQQHYTLTAAIDRYDSFLRKHFVPSTTNYLHERLPI